MSRLIFVASLIVGCICLMFVPFAANSSAQAKKPARPLSPFNLAALNTKSDEDDPYVSRDGTRLLYASNASGHYTLLISQQRDRIQFFPGSERWPAGKELEGPNSDFDN